VKITAVEPILMSCPLPEPLLLPFHGGERTILKRDAMLIRVKADHGLTGYAPGPAHERAASIIKREIEPFLVEKDPRNWATFRFEGSPETVKTYRAVEIALLDLVSRGAGCPLSDLMGGRVRDRIKLYGSAGMYMAPEKYADEAAAIAESGFAAYKMRAGIGPDDDLETVRLMRQAVGPDIGLMVDAHTWWRMGDSSYTFDMVAQLAGQISEYGLTWLEEPLPPENHAAYRDLRAQRSVPLASGEHEPDLAGLLDLVEKGAVDLVQMDLLCQGGIDTAQRIFAAIEHRNLRFAFHCWGTALEVAAAAQLGVCWPGDVVEWLEYPCYANSDRPGMYPFSLADEILTEPLQIEDGYLVLPDAPGLGVEVDEGVIEKYPFIPGPWSFFHLHSPRETIAVTGDHSIKWIEDRP